MFIGTWLACKLLDQRMIMGTRILGFGKPVFNKKTVDPPNTHAKIISNRSYGGGKGATTQPHHLLKGAKPFSPCFGEKGGNAKLSWTPPSTCEEQTGPPGIGPSEIWKCC